MKKETLKIQLIVVDHGDPSVGMFGTNYDVTLSIDPVCIPDEEEMAIFKFGIEKDLRKLLADHFDSGSRLSIYTKDEIENLNFLIDNYGTSVE